MSAVTNNDPAVALRSCAEGEAGALVIEMVNNRPYGVVMHVDAPTRWRWRATPEDPAELLAAAALDAYLPKDQFYLPPLGQASIGLKKGQWTEAELTTDATKASIVATYVGIAVGGVVTPKAAKLLAGDLAGTCLASFIKTNADATVGHSRMFAPWCAHRSGAWNDCCPVRRTILV